MVSLKSSRDLNIFLLISKAGIIIRDMFVQSLDTIWIIHPPIR
jgi:hypothetical protein